MSGSAFGITQPPAPGTCPCGSGRYAQCCRPVHLGQRLPRTAEELMRSRYSAFAVGDGDYLLASWHPMTRPGDLRLDPARTWTGLDVLRVDRGGEGDADGVVEYRARSTAQGRDSVLHEISRFERVGGRWVYVDGDFPD